MEKLSARCGHVCAEYTSARDFCVTCIVLNPLANTTCEPKDIGGSIMHKIRFTCVALAVCCLLALAGILTQDFDNLSKVFTEAGAVELERFTEKEWTSGLFRRVK